MNNDKGRIPRIGCTIRLLGSVEAPDPMKPLEGNLWILRDICGWRQSDQCHYLESFWEDGKYMKRCGLLRVPPRCGPEGGESDETEG